jgi:hypothetical protein
MIESMLSRLAVGFIRSHDSVSVRIARVVTDFDRSAEVDSIAGGMISNDLQDWQALLQVPDAPIQPAQFLLTVDVFGILLTVALRGSRGQCFHNITAPKPDVIELLL